MADHLPSMIATLYKADGSQLARDTLPGEILSRTEVKNASTVRSRSGRRNPRPLHVESAAPTTAHFAGGEGESEDNCPDPPAVPPLSLPQFSVRSDVGAPLTTPASAPPITPSRTETYSTLHFFNLILPDRGYVGQTVRLYGATFSRSMNYYAKFGELEPTPLAWQNTGLLEGWVPERDETGPVFVRIIDGEGISVCNGPRRFVYVGHDRKNG
jgi:hypothetical protein